MRFRKHVTSLAITATALLVGAAALLMNAYAAELSDATQRRDDFRRRVLDLLHPLSDADFELH